MQMRKEREHRRQVYSFLDFWVEVNFSFLAFVKREETSRSSSRDADTIWHSRIGLPLTFFWPTQKKRRRRRIWWRALSRHVSVEMNRCRSIWERPAAAVADDCRLPLLTYSSPPLREENISNKCQCSHILIVHFHIKILRVRRLLLSTVEL